MRSTRTIPHAGQDGLEPPPLSSINPRLACADPWPGRGISGGSLGRWTAWSSAAVAFWAAGIAGSARWPGACWRPSPRAPRPRVARLAEFLRDDERLSQGMQRSTRWRCNSTDWPAAGDDSRARPAGLVAGPGDHDARRAGRLPGARAQRARLVRRLPGPRAIGRRRAASPLPVPLGGQAVRLAPPDRGTQAAAQAASAPAARRDLAAHPAARRGSWLSARPVGHDVRRASCRPDDRAQDGPPRLLRLDHERPG